LAGRTGGDLSVPVKTELLDGEGALGMGLPLIVGRGRPDKRDAVITSAGHKLVGINVAGIDEVTLRVMPAWSVLLPLPVPPAMNTSPVRGMDAWMISGSTFCSDSGLERTGRARATTAPPSSPWASTAVALTRKRKRVRRSGCTSSSRRSPRPA